MLPTALPSSRHARASTAIFCIALTIVGVGCAGTFGPRESDARSVQRGAGDDGVGARGALIVAHRGAT